MENQTLRVLSAAAPELWKIKALVSGECSGANRLENQSFRGGGRGECSGARMEEKLTFRGGACSGPRIVENQNYRW